MKLLYCLVVILACNHLANAKWRKCNAIKPEKVSNNYIKTLNEILKEVRNPIESEKTLESPKGEIGHTHPQHHLRPDHAINPLELLLDPSAFWPAIKKLIVGVVRGIEKIAPILKYHIAAAQDDFTLFICHFNNFIEETYGEQSRNYVETIEQGLQGILTIIKSTSDTIQHPPQTPDELENHRKATRSLVLESVQKIAHGIEGISKIAQKS